MEEYVFKIIKKNIIQEKDYFKFKYDIKVVITRCAILYLRLEISRHIKDSRFRLESLFIYHK
jgi:hypothetical protein